MKWFKKENRSNKNVYFIQRVAFPLCNGVKLIHSLKNLPCRRNLAQKEERGEAGRNKQDFVKERYEECSTKECLRKILVHFSVIQSKSKVCLIVREKYCLTLFIMQEGNCSKLMYTVKKNTLTRKKTVTPEEVVLTSATSIFSFYIICRHCIWRGSRASKLRFDSSPKKRLSCFVLKNSSFMTTISK